MAYHGLLQGRGPLADPVPLVLDRVLLHASLEALSKSAEPALVSLVLVHGAVSGEPAAICVLLANASSEESLTSVAGGCPVMLSSCSVTTYRTVLRENT